MDSQGTQGDVVGGGWHRDPQGHRPHHCSSCGLIGTCELIGTCDPIAACDPSEPFVPTESVVGEGCSASVLLATETVGYTVRGIPSEREEISSHYFPCDLFL